MLIKDVQRPKGFAIVGSTMNEVIAPYMIAILRPQPNTRPIVQPKPSFLRLFLWHFQPLPSPKPFNPPVADRPASLSQQRGDPAIAISAVLSGQLNHVGHQSVFVCATSWDAPLRGPVLSTARGRRVSQKRSAGYEHDRCRHDDERGSVVSLCGFRQDQFVQRQI